MENPEKICDVCKEAIEIYAIGECDHPICLTCSTRMRILIEQDYCPICRGNLPKVIFTDDLKPFKEISAKSLITHEEHGIFFQSRKVKERFHELLQHRCPACPDRAPDPNFKRLETHLKRDHQLFFCDLCLRHLNLFTHERKIYSRKDLATHRRIGDADEKSYKGHPLCQFCDVRYMDKDELFRHLRKDHFSCHFCGDDEFYSDYSQLRNHFKTDHFLCQEGECGSPNTRFTHAFRSEIDLKGHRAMEHMQTLSKSQAKEVRTLDLEFNYANAPRRRERGQRSAREEGEGGRDRPPRNRGDRYDRREQEDLNRALELSRKESQGNQRGRDSPSSFEGGQRGGRGRKSPQEETQNSSPSPPPPPVPVDLEHYPTLNGKEPPAPLQRRPVKLEEDFPSLSRGPGAVSAPSRGPAAPASLASKLSRPTSASEAAALRPSPAPSSATSSPRSSSRPEPSLTAKRPENAVSAAATMRAPRDEDFPTLGSGSRGGASLSGAWMAKGKGSQPAVVQAPPRTEQRVELGRGMGVHVPPKKVEFGRKLHDDSEFPSLGGGRSAAIVPPGNWVKKNSGKQNSSRKEVRAEPATDWFDIRDSFANEFTDTVLKKTEEDFVKASGKNKKKKATQESSAPKPLPGRESSSSASSASKTQILTPPSWEEQSFSPSPLPDRNGWSDSPTDFANASDSGSDGEFTPAPVRKVEPKSAPPPSFNLGTDFPDLGAGSRKDAYPGQSQANRKKKSKAAAKPVEKPAPKVEDTGASKSLDSIASMLLGPKPLPKSHPQSHPRPLPKQPAQPAPAEEVSRATLSSTSDADEDEENEAPEDWRTEVKVNGTDGGSDLKAPPGFQQKSVNSLPAPPPGFGPVPENPSYSYLQPPDFSQRNVALVGKMKEVLGDGFKFEQFKRLSGQFRQEQLRASDYYNSCRDLIGLNKFTSVFPELLALLPDIGKQKELFKVHQVSVNRDKSKAPPISKKKMSWNIEETLTPCPVCQQVLVPEDMAFHMEQHNQSDIPAFPLAASRIGVK